MDFLSQKEGTKNRPTLSAFRHLKSAQGQIFLYFFLRSVNFFFKGFSILLN